LSIIFPTFATKALIGHNDIYLGAAPVNTTSLLLDQDRITPTTSPLSSETRPSFCHHVIQFQDEVTSESKKVDNLLIQLCQDYQDVKTPRQLDLEVPAGIRQQSEHQRQLQYHKNSTTVPSSSYVLTEDNINKFSSIQNYLRILSYCHHPMILLQTHLLSFEFKYLSVLINHLHPFHLESLAQKILFVPVLDSGASILLKPIYKNYIKTLSHLIHYHQMLFWIVVIFLCSKSLLETLCLFSD